MSIFLFHSNGLVPKFLTITEPECPHGHMRWDGMIPSKMYLGSHGNISFISPPKGEDKIYWMGSKLFYLFLFFSKFSLIFHSGLLSFYAAFTQFSFARHLLTFQLNR